MTARFSARSLRRLITRALATTALVALYGLSTVTIPSFTASANAQNAPSKAKSGRGSSGGGTKARGSSGGGTKARGSSGSSGGSGGGKARSGRGRGGGGVAVQGGGGRGVARGVSRGRGDGRSRGAGWGGAVIPFGFPFLDDDDD